MYYLQQITQHQERFVQMLNEPRGGDTGGEGAEAQGLPHTNYIQVTPQEKEAIERVSSPFTLTLQSRDLLVSLLSPTELPRCLGNFSACTMIKMG